jgi:AraC-like DNA-binding protein
MSGFKPSGVARVPLAILHYAEGLGLDRGKILRMAGLGEEDLADPDGRVPLERLVATWQATASLTGDERLGLHMGASTTVRQLGLMGYAMAHSDTFRDACRIGARYSRIIQEAAAVTFEENDECGWLRVSPAPVLDVIRHPVDARLALIVAVSREITGADITPVKVCFPYPEPADATAYREFFRGPVAFDEPYSQVAFKQRDLQRPLLSADPALAGYMYQLAEEVLASLTSEGELLEQVRRAIWTDLSGGLAGLEAAAGRLGMGPRSLQRRLKEEGTSFMEVLDDLRHEMAVQMLHDRRVTVYEIAFLLGYSDPSTFFRAFRRWEGTSPHEFRRSRVAGRRGGR